MFTSFTKPSSSGGFSPHTHTMISYIKVDYSYAKRPSSSSIASKMFHQPPPTNNLYPAPTISHSKQTVYWVSYFLCVHNKLRGSWPEKQNALFLSLGEYYPVMQGILGICSRNFLSSGSLFPLSSVSFTNDKFEFVMPFMYKCDGSLRLMHELIL